MYMVYASSWPRRNTTSDSDSDFICSYITQKIKLAMHNPWLLLFVSRLLLSYLDNMLCICKF